MKKIIIFLLLLFFTYSTCIAYTLTNEDRQLLDRAEQILDKKYKEDIGYFNKVNQIVTKAIPSLTVDNRKSKLIKNLYGIIQDIANKEGQLNNYEVCLSGYEFMYSLRYSYKGEKLGFIGKEFGGKRSVVINGKKEKGYSSLSNFNFAKHGDGYIYTGGELDRKVLVKDGYELGSYNHIMWDTHLFDKNRARISPRGSSYALVTLDEENDIETSNHILIKDGSIIGEYQDVSRIGYSYDDKSFSYIYSNSETVSSGSKINKDGIILSQYDNVFDFEYANNSSKFALVNKENGAFSLYLDGKKIHTSSNKISIMGFFTKDDILLFTEYGSGGYKYINGKLLKVTNDEYDYVLELKLSNDGNTLVYEGHIDNDKYLIVNGDRIKDDNFFDIIIDDVGLLGKYVYHNGTNLIIGGENINQYGYVDSGGYAYSPDGKDFSFIARENSKYSLLSTDCSLVR